MFKGSPRVFRSLDALVAYYREPYVASVRTAGLACTAYALLDVGMMRV